MVTQPEKLYVVLIEEMYSHECGFAFCNERSPEMQDKDFCERFLPEEWNLTKALTLLENRNRDIFEGTVLIGERPELSKKQRIAIKHFSNTLKNVFKFRVKEPNEGGRIVGLWSWIGEANLITNEVSEGKLVLKRSDKPIEDYA